MAILSNPIVRHYLGQMGIGNLAQTALPDLERYLKLRSMEKGILAGGLTSSCNRCRPAFAGGCCSLCD